MVATATGSKARPPGSLLGRIGAKSTAARLFLLCFLGGYALTEFFADKDIQDALQYRENLETGVYEREETQGYFGLLVVTLRDLFPSADPFVLIGTLIAALFIHSAIKIRPRTTSAVMFAIVLVMPMMYLNFTQVLRQGVAVSLIIYALLKPASLPRSALLLGAGLVHKTYLPFVLVLLAREFILKLVARSYVPSRKPQQVFDALIFFGLFVFWLAAAVLAPEFVDADVLEKYFAVDVSNAKRVFVAMLLITYLALVYPKTPHPLAAFTAYAVLSIALILPVTVDFLRLHTFIMPLMVFTALLCESPRRSLAALTICFLLSLYVTPVLGLSNIL